MRERGSRKGKLDGFWCFPFIKRKLKRRRESEVDFSKLRFYP